MEDDQATEHDHTDSDDPWLGADTDPGLIDSAGTSLEEGDGTTLSDSIGEGHAADVWWQGQSENGLCVPTAVAMLVSEWQGNAASMFFEGEVREAAFGMGLLEPAEDGGWKGMTSEGAVALLDHYGIETEVEHGSMLTLAEHLAEHREIILAVDSDEIWYGSEADDLGPTDAGADHAVRITGINVEEGVAILEDPGDPQGMGREVPLDLLEDAWADSDHEMVVTDTAPPWQGGAVSEVADPAPVVETPTGPETPIVDTEPLPPAPSDGPDDGWTWTAPDLIGTGGFVILPIYLVGKALRERLSQRSK